MPRGHALRDARHFLGGSDVEREEQRTDERTQQHMAVFKKLLRDDVVMSMPPYDFWLSGPDQMAEWFVGEGKGCEGSRLVAVAELDLKAVFERDPAYFSAQARLRVSALTVPAGAAAPDAAELQSALQGGRVPETWKAVDLPAQALPLPQIAQRLGGSAAELLRTAERGRVLGPQAAGDAQLYVMLHERLADTPRYEDVADAVRTELARRQAEAALERLLATLRSTTPIRTAPAP